MIVDARQKVIKEDEDGELPDFKNAKKVDNGYLVEEDIILTAEQMGIYERMKRGEVIGGNKRNLPAFAKKWPNNIIPYKIVESNYPDIIRQSLNVLNSRSCVKFEEIPLNDTTTTDYIKVVYGQWCWSNVGKVYNQPQVITLANSCHNAKYVHHEFLHAAGFLHEQSRPDRDDFIKVNYDNIWSSDHYEFSKLEFSEWAGYYFTPYDYHSVLHYYEYAFSNGKGPSIVPVTDGVVLSGPTATALDILELNLLYDCPHPFNTLCGTPDAQCTSGKCCNTTTCTFLNSMRVCRPSLGGCDIEEKCTGASSECPADKIQPLDFVCRASGSSCDPEEKCDGVSTSCPVDVFDVNAECVKGSCCDSATCKFMNSSSLCRPSFGSCDEAEYCTGTTNECPDDSVSPNTKMCRRSYGVCDPAEYCDGYSKWCGTDYAYWGNVCRPSSTACDPAEVCRGCNECPPDVYDTTKECPKGDCCDYFSCKFQTSTHICRPSIDLNCDPQESCTGASATCPADINTCAK